MSKFIDLVETFDLSSLKYGGYSKKIDGLIKRFPKYEKDDRFRTVLADKFNQNADDYISMKFCTIGRHPVYGIYNRRDLNLVAVCVERIMYALDDCDLHPSFVPDLNVHKLYLGIQYTPLATRETLNYTKKCMCSAISTLSLGYTPQKKNEWCEALVLLTGMTSQAVRFSKMKEHVGTGLHFINAHSLTSFDGRYEVSCRNLSMFNRWNKISKAIRKGEYPYVFSHYLDQGVYYTTNLCEFIAGCDVSLINAKDKTKTEKLRRKIDKWNGPLRNSKRKCEEESHRRWYMEREARRNMKKMDDKVSERMHGFWYGSVDTFKYEVACVNWLLRPAQMVGPNRFLTSATSHLGRLKDILQAQRILALVLLAVKNFWREVDLLTCFQGTSMILENWRSKLDGSDCDICFKRPRPNPSFQAAAIHMAIVDCRSPVFSAATFYLCAKHHKVMVDKISFQSDINYVSTYVKDPCFRQFGIPKAKIDRKEVNWNREPRPFVQVGCAAGIYGTLETTCVCPLGDATRRMNAQHSNVIAGYSGMSRLFKEKLQYKGPFYKGLVPNLLNIVPSGKAARKLKKAVSVWI